MKKRGKRYNEAVSKIEKSKLYTKEEACKLVKETSNSKFDGTIELAMHLNVDTKKAGTYYLTYVATDSSGNKEEIVRKVVVNEKSPTVLKIVQLVLFL